jgi:hypothetical protein
VAVAVASEGVGSALVVEAGCLSVGEDLVAAVAG